MVKLSDTWLVAQIGDSSYAINKEYAIGMMEMSKAELKSASGNSGFIKGIYNIYNVKYFFQYSLKIFVLEKFLCPKYDICYLGL